jgi:hypothetical protein
MPQIFHPSTNTISRVSIFGAVFFIGLVVWLLMAIDRSAAVTRINVVRDQPIPFSHAHHVGEIGLHCLMCHPTVEQAPFAGMPSTETCMGCHQILFADSPMLEPVFESFRTGEPIRWTRVYDLPDFAAFDHSIHVAKGIGCTACHGEIHRMPLTWKAETLKMEWCLECHRNPVRYVRPREEVFNVHWDPASLSRAQRQALVEEYRIESKTSCSICHY